MIADIFNRMVGILPFRRIKDKGVHLQEGTPYTRQDINIYNCFDYWEDCTALRSVTNRLSNDIARIGIVDKDEEKSELVDLLIKSNQPKLLENIALSILLSGNAFVLAKGSIRGLPFELEYIHLNRIKYNQSEDTIEILEEATQVNTVLARFTFDKKTKRWLSGGLLELIHFKTTVNNSNSRLAESPLQPLVAKLDMLIASDNYNANLVLNGFSSKGILSIDGDNITDDYIEKAKTKIRKTHSGSSNSGNIVLLDGASSTYHDISKSTRDMDYKELIKNAEQSIYTLYGIPLPLISQETMTLNNFSQANYQYYEHAVLPLIYNILNAFNYVFKHRNVNFNLLVIDSASLPPTLSVVIYQSMQEAQKTQSLTLNEIRSIGNYEELKVNGNKVFASKQSQIASLVEEELDTTNTNDNDKEDKEEEEEEKKQEK